MTTKTIRTAAALPAPKDRAEHIYQSLFDAIVAQQLMPETKLSEEAIGSFFAVSRTVVRTVFNRLQSASLIELRQNRGAFVASPSIEESQQIFQARFCIEREVCELLIKTITPAGLIELQGLLEAEREAHRAGDSTRAIKLSGEFHLLMARLAGNQVLAGFLSELISRTSLILLLHGRQATSECGLEEHQAIIDALRAKNNAGLVDVMRHHLQEIVDRTHLSQPKQGTTELLDVLSRFAPKAS